MSEEKGLIKVEKLVIEDVFKVGGTKTIIEAIKERVEFEIKKHDVSTPKGRKDLRSLAAKVVKSKTFLDGSGKELKEKYMVIVSPIDSERKIARDTLDALRDEIKEPVEKFEAELAKKEADKLFQEEYSLAWDNAHIDAVVFNQKLQEEFEKQYAEAWETAHDNNELFDLRKDKEKKESEEKAAKAETERLENEARIKKEAGEKATKDAEEKIEREKKEAADKKFNARIQRLGNLGFTLIGNIFVIRSPRGDIELNTEHISIDDAGFESLINRVTKRLEEDRVEAEKIKAQKEQDEALEKQRKDLEEKARVEKKRLADLKAESDRKAKNLNHQKAVNNRVKNKLVACGIHEDKAIDIMESILKNPIPEISINYGNY